MPTRKFPIKKTRFNYIKRNQRTLTLLSAGLFLSAGSLFILYILFVSPVAILLALSSDNSMLYCSYAIGFFTFFFVLLSISWLLLRFGMKEMEVSDKAFLYRHIIPYFSHTVAFTNIKRIIISGSGNKKIIETEDGYFYADALDGDFLVELAQSIGAKCVRIN